ncbi:MAG TPA: hypothetical protein VL738_27535 [Dactylosporangium sp.]|jgi:hypothetical protein|nr:hypothetical protein [Dactylosporangium sp.]
MTDLEGRVSAALMERADRTLAVDGLHEKAVRTARGIRRRRWFGTAAAAIVAAGALLLGLTAGGAVTTSLPLETAAPPGGVGSDPALLHFDIDMSRMPPRLRDRVVAMEWVSGKGYEKVTGVGRDDQLVFMIALTTETDRAREWVAGLDGGDTRAMEWGSSDTGSAGVVATRWDDRELFWDVIRAVRMDRVQRCVMPLHLAELPEGASWSECQTRLRYGGPAGSPVWIYSGLTVTRADGKIVFIWADGRPLASPSFHADRAVGGYPAQWLSGNEQFKNGLWVPAFGPYQLYITDFETAPADWFAPDVAQWYAARLTPSTNLSDPSSWPRRAVG